MLEDFFEIMISYCVFPTKDKLYAMRSKANMLESEAKITGYDTDHVIAKRILDFLPTV